MMANAIVKEPDAASMGGEWNAECIALVKKSICPDLTDGEMALFIEVCKRAGLDPVRRQIYAIKRAKKDRDGRVTGHVVTHQTSIDGFRVLAQRSGKYAGQVGPFWCGPDGIWKDVWLEKSPPAAAKVGVMRVGFVGPLWGVARLESYASDNLWRRMPEVMIAKCAEALALRKAFPEDASGLYTTEEMQQADAPTDPQTGEIRDATPAQPAPSLKPAPRAELPAAVRFDPTWDASKQKAPPSNGEDLAGDFTRQLLEAKGRANLLEWRRCTDAIARAVRAGKLTPIEADALRNLAASTKAAIVAEEQKREEENEESYDGDEPSGGPL